METPCPQCAELRRALNDALARITSLEHQIHVLTRELQGRGSERKRMPSIDSERPKKDEAAQAAARAKAAERRAENQKPRQDLPTKTIAHAVPADERVCPLCGGREFHAVGEGEISEEYEWVPGHLERLIHVRETLACRCGGHMVTAPVPAKVFDKCRFGPGLIAHLITAKCGDSLPLHRLETQFKRIGVPLSRSTLTDLFHRAAALLTALRQCMLDTVAVQFLVFADETRIKVQAPGKTRKAWMWTFIARVPGPDGRLHEVIVYKYSPSRSGQTPVEVLGATPGTLVVDAYTGYNHVCTPEARERGGCWAHCRRKFFDALSSAPEARTGMDFIRDLYAVEAEAKAAGVLNTAAHRVLRETKARPIVDRFHAWVEENQPHHTPESGLGKAFTYAVNQKEALCRFLANEAMPLDNNISERALRAVALGRKNFLFVGHDQAGENLAVLYSLVASCTANGINPEAYLADVLMRIQTHPAADIQDLMPHRWKSKFSTPPPE